MKKAISISLLAVFFLFQTGRILLYFECRFSNSITTTSCNCVQILTDVKPGSPGDVIPPANHTNHRHLPEEFEMGNAIPFTASVSNTHAIYINYTEEVCTAWCDDIFHPPIV